MTIGTDLDKALAQAAATDKAASIATNARIDALVTGMALLDARVKKLEAPVVVVPPVVVPPVIVPPPTSGSFKALRSKALIPSAGPQPAVGASVLNTTTGAIVRRVANGIIDYGRFTRTSVDDKYLLLHKENSTSSQVLDRASGTVILDLPNLGEVNELRWDYSGKNSTFYFVRGMTFNSMDVATGKETLIRDFTPTFPGADFIGTDVEGDSSNDSNRWAWMAWKRDGNGDYPLAIFSYEKSTNRILGVLLPEDVVQGADDKAHSPPWRMGRPNMVEMIPDGTKVLIHWNRAWESGSDSVNKNLIGTVQDGPHAFAVELGASTVAPIKMAVDATHSAWAKLADGTDCLVSQDNREDYIIATTIKTGFKPGAGGSLRITAHADIGWNNGMHFAKSYTRRGQVLVSTSSPTNKDWGENQLFLLDLLPYDAAKTMPVRVSPSNNVYPGQGEAYRNEGTAALNHAGNRAYLTANWNTATRSIYEVQM